MDNEQSELEALCGRCLWHSLQTCVRVRGMGETTFVGESHCRMTCDVECSHGPQWHPDLEISQALHSPPPCLANAATGDIDDMWLRDSSVQLAIYLPRTAAHPALRAVFEGMLRSQAFYILQVQCDIALSKPLSLCTECTASSLTSWLRAVLPRYLQAC